MAVPSSWWKVGWYILGRKPGEEGSAVIAGHLDSPTGKAVFWNLSQLSVGDEIEVLGEKGEQLKFRVTETHEFKDNSFPLELVFKGKGKRELNLITCTGTYNSQAQNYSDRLVVFSELVEKGS